MTLQEAMRGEAWPRLRSRAKLLYTLFFVKHGPNLWTTATLAELAELTGLSTRTIERACTELVAVRMMDVDGSGGAALRYRVRTPAILAGGIAA
jgi:hypothetical protein